MENNPLEQLNTNPVAKYTLKQWISHPTTILLAVAVNIIWALIVYIVWNSNRGKDDCMKQVVKLEERVKVLEKIQDDYVKSILFKDGQIKNRDNVIDSLKRKDGV